MTVPSFKLLDGSTIPAVAHGNGTGDAKPKAVETGLLALEAGLRHIDTAQGYDNEGAAGEVIKKSGLSRGDIWLTTKLSQPGGDPAGEQLPLSKLTESVKGSLERLGTQPDLILVHNPFLAGEDNIVELWQALEKLKDDGVITGSLGVSNFWLEQLEPILAVAKYKPVVNQLEYHPFLLAQLDPLLALQEKHGILTEAYGPLTPLLRHPTGGELKPILERIAKRVSTESQKGDFDAAQVLLKWTVQKGVVAVTASGNAGRIKGLAAVQEIPDLSPTEVAEIEKAGRAIHFRYYTEHLKQVPAPDLPSQ